MGSNLLVNTQAKRRAYLEEHASLLARLVERGQQPSVMFIGCSDSRVVPEGLLGAAPGDVFVLRTVANIVPPYESGEHAAAAAVDYAVTALQVSDIVVCGHTECGGINALAAGMAGLTEGLQHWLEQAGPVVARSAQHTAPQADAHRAMVEENVRIQLEHLRAYPAVDAARAAGKLTLHGWVKDLKARRIYYLDAADDTFKPE